MNDSPTFRELFDLYADTLLSISYGFVKDWGVAEDITQEVFMNYWRKEQQFRHESSLKTYLIRATINRSKDYLKSWRYRTHTFTNFFTQHTYAKQQLIEKEERSALTHAILNLPLEYREIILLYYYEELTYREVAAILQQPETTVKNRMKKAQELLRQQLPNEPWEVLLNESY